MFKRINTQSQKIKPFFSIITVVKNNQKNILKTVKSISNQTFKNFEYIIIDGKSYDKTINKIINNNFYSLLISEKDNGIYDAMNKGIKYSKGKVIIFVNSGDLLDRNALKFVHREFSKDPNISFVFGTVLRHYTKQSILKYGYNFLRMQYNFDFATAHSTGFFLKKKIYDEIGLYDTNFKCSADYDMYFRVYKKKLKGSFTSKKDVVGEVASGGFSSKVSFLSHLLEETKIRIKNKQNYLMIILIFFNSLVKRLFK